MNRLPPAGRRAMSEERLLLGPWLMAGCCSQGWEMGLGRHVLCSGKSHLTFTFPLVSLRETESFPDLRVQSEIDE